MTCLDPLVSTKHDVPCATTGLRRFLGHPKCLVRTSVWGVTRTSGPTRLSVISLECTDIPVLEDGLD